MASESAFVERFLVVQRDLGTALAATSDLGQALDLCLAAACEIDGIDCGGVYLVQADTGALDLARHRGLPDAFVASAHYYAPDAPQTQLVMAGRPICTPYARLAAISGPDRQAEGLHTLAVIPIGHEGQVIAALNLASHTQDELSAQAQSAMAAIAAQVGGAIDRVRAANALHRSQQNLQALFDALDDLLFIVDGAGRILKTNPVVERRLGYPDAALRGQSVLVIHPPERREEAGAIMAQMLAGQTAVCTVPLQARDGTLIPVETRVVRGEWDRKEVLFGVSRDVSERVRADTALRNSEEQLRALIDHSPSAIIVFDVAGQIRLWNAAAERMYGWRADEVLGQTLPTVPAENEAERLAFQAHINRGESIGYTEVARRRKDGSTIHVGLSVAPLRDATGAVYAQMSLAADITERVHMEQALRASEEQYRQLLERVPAPVVVYALDDPNFSLLYANRYAEALWLAAGGEGGLVGQPAGLFVPEAEQDLFVEIVARLRSGGRWDGIEERLVGPNGRELNIIASSTPIEFQGQVAAMLVINDITELKRAQTELVRREQLLSALEEREQLARDLHDGLGQVLGYLNIQAQATQSLLANAQTAAAQSNLQQMARTAQETQGDLRNYILGLRAASTAPGTFSEALAGALREFSTQWGIATTFSLPAEAPAPTFAPAVEEQALRIIQEALTNICKHADAQKVEVILSCTDAQAEVAITDDGMGFDAAALSGMAAKHFGLSIMRERAERIGAQLEIRSTPGGGTRVLLAIPRPPAAGPAAGEPEQSPASAEPQHVRLLLVDDHPLFLDGLRNLLTMRGLTVIGLARDGLEAQAQARALRPDVIVMDAEMPRCNGLEATRAIKAEFPEIKIIMLTVSDADATLFDAIQSGASGYLLKNLDTDRFVRLLVGQVRGEASLAPGLADRVLAEFARRTPPPEAGMSGLTARQWAILQQVAQGLTYKEVAAAIFVSERTVKYTMGQILERLHLENREQAIAYAHRLQGLHR